MSNTDKYKKFNKKCTFFHFRFVRGRDDKYIKFLQGLDNKSLWFREQIDKELSE